MWHIFTNHIKAILRIKAVVFWTLMFPIILATFFNFAFSNLTTSEQFKSFEIGVVKDENYLNEKNFKQVIDTMSVKGDKNVFITTYYDNEDEAKKALKESEISGYYIVKDKINLMISTNGIDQTIMKHVVDNYYQSIKIMNNIYDFDASKFSIELIKELNSNKNYFNDITNKNTDVTVVYFYTLIAMVCMYGAMYGMQLTTITEANLSKKGARITVAPTNRIKTLVASLLAGLVIQFTFLLILFAYMTLILKVDFGNRIIPLLFLIFIGTSAGVSLGLCAGVISKKNENVKSGILLAIIMFGCFLSGMMFLDIKYIIQENLPILAKINPLSVITDALYSLYYYTDLSRYFENIIYLLIFMVAMLVISFFFLRRKKYDSI